MSYLTHPTFLLRSTEEMDQSEPISRNFQRQSPHAASIHILDDDSLLNMFSLYRLFVLGEGEGDDWDRERWWYRLAHVCRRWRYLILGSASYLRLCLVCTYGTPIADLLALLPHLPLVIYFNDEDRDIATEVEEGIILALEQRDRVCCIHLCMPVPNLQKVIMAIDEEYPILEYLIIGNEPEECTALMLPDTLQAPHLRLLTLINFALPIGSRLLTTSVGLVALCLAIAHPSTFVHPNTLLQWLSFMPLLKALVFSFPPDHYVGLRLTDTPIMTMYVTLPNLQFFGFEGHSLYLEEVIHRITTPHLEKLEIHFFMQTLVPVRRLLQFVNATENLKFDSVKFKFSKEGVCTDFYSREEVKFSIYLVFECLSWQLNCVGVIFFDLSQMFFAVEHLTLEWDVQEHPLEEYSEGRCTMWYTLFRPFSNVKTLYIDDGLVVELSRCLRRADEELPLEVLPELRELTYSGNGNASDVFASFIDARQNAGRPVTLVRRSPSSSSPEPSLEASAIISAPRGGAGNDFDT